MTRDLNLRNNRHSAPADPVMQNRSRADNYLFLGTHGHVLAIDQLDGRTVWSTSLPGTGYQVVVMLVEAGKLYCASGGHAFALDPIDGSILWTNDLPGMGKGIVALCTLRSSAGESGALSAQNSANQASNASASTTTALPG